MCSRPRARRPARRDPIPANPRELSIGAILFALVLTMVAAGETPKCFAATSSGEDGASAEAHSATVALPAVSPGTATELSGTDHGLPLEEAGVIAEFAAIRLAPAIPDPPRIFDRDHNAPRPGLSKPCFLPPQNLCRALKDRRVVLLGGLQTAALISDGISTRQFLSHGYREVDPVAKIFIGSKPTWARMAPIGAAQALVGMWLGERMATSRHLWVRRFWWLPQTLGIAGNVAATIHNLPLRSSIAQAN